VSPLPDADDGDRILDGYARAQAVLGYDEGPTPALADSVVAWAGEIGLTVSFARELDDDGLGPWYLWIETPRGTAKDRPRDDETWRGLIARLSLLPPHAPRA
jgi:hypothetical protein